MYIICADILCIIEKIGGFGIKYGEKAAQLLIFSALSAKIKIRVNFIYDIGNKGERRWRCERGDIGKEN